MMSTSRFTIDLNCDVGEGFGPYSLGDDDGLLQQVTSANIACGFHAGDPRTMRRTILTAVKHKVAIGAHPGFPDREGFGRRKWEVTPTEVYDLVMYQVGALSGFVRAAGSRMRHVKPHGALYNMAAKDARLAEAIAQAVADFDPDLILVGLAESHLVSEGLRLGLQVSREAFADRTYEADGGLTSRDIASSVLSDPAVGAIQAVRIVTERSVVSRTGVVVPLTADTICIHGDRPGAAEFAKTVRQSLIAAGIVVTPFMAGQV